MDVSIIIVTYNSERFISNCLTSIYNHRTACEYEVIVVDNASQDNTCHIVSEFDQATLIQNSNNEGFSKANNRGIRQATGQYVMLLNPDVLMDDYCIDRLLETLKKDPAIGIVAPQLVYSNGAIQESARRFPNLWVQVLSRIPLIKHLIRKQYNQYMMHDWDHTTSRHVDWVIGAAMLCERRKLVDLGMFDEDFFLYCEDIDLCYRFMVANYTIYYNAEVSLTHDYQKQSSSSINRQTLLHVRSIIQFYAKHPELLF